MKQLVLSVEESKYKFLVEVLQHFDFVKIERERKDKKVLLKEIAEGMHSASLAAAGKIVSRPAKTFLHDL